MKIWKEQDPKSGKYKWYGDGTVGGRRLRPSGLATKAEVEAVFAVARARMLQRKYDLPAERADVRLSELVEEAGKDLDLRKRNHRRVKAVREMFRDLVPGDPLVAELSARHLLDFKRARLAGSRLKPGSLNLELVYVGQMLRDAGRYFPALESWKAPAAPYEPNARRGRERVVTEEEGDRLLAELRAPRRTGAREHPLAHLTRLIVADLWELAPHVAMRTTELRTLEKSWVDFREALLRLPAHATKGGRAREVPLNADALAVLRRRSLASPHPRYVFASAKGTAVLAAAALYRELKRASLRAGLPYGQHVEGGFRPHDNRHTGITRMLQSGADTASVGDIVGHSTHYMTLRYSHPSLESKRRAVENLERKREGVDKKSTASGGGGRN